MRHPTDCAAARSAGAKLGSPKVHRDLTGTTERSAGTSKVVNHPAPGRLIIVRAVDPHAIHAGANQRM